jgi:ankyrin repeat protein
MDSDKFLQLVTKITKTNNNDDFDEFKKIYQEDFKKNNLGLSYCFVKNNFKFAQYLIDNNNDINSKDDSGCTGLYQFDITADFANFLIQNGADVNTVNKDGYTPLHAACVFPKYDIIYLLVKNGANVNIENIFGDTPLHIACRYRQYASIDILIKNGANVNCENEKCYSPLGHLIENYYNNNNDSKIDKNFIKCAELLIKNGANIHEVKRYPKIETALSLACKKCGCLIDILCKNGADPNQLIDKKVYFFDTKTEIDKLHTLEFACSEANEKS